MSNWGVPLPGSHQQHPPFGPQAGQISEGTITYTTSTDQHEAVHASYQTPNGVVSGIQWIPAEATQVLPVGAKPASPDFVASWNRGDLSREEAKKIEKWQREEEKRRRKEEKEARKIKERRDQESELRRARERDAQIMAGRSRKSSFNTGGGYGGYSAYERDRKYSSGASDLDRRFADLDLDRGRDRDRGYERERKISSTIGRPRTYSSGNLDRPRTLSGNVGGYPPTSGYPATGYTGAGASPYHGGASPNLRGSEPGYGLGGGGYGAFPPSPNRSMSDSFAGPQVYPKGHVLEGQPIRSSRAPSPNPGSVSFPSGPAFPQPTVPGGMGASPLLGATHGQQLETPAGFGRPINHSQTLVPFENMKIQNMDDFLEHIPRMPLVLQPHDVLHDDWIRMMQDLARAWSGSLPVREMTRGGRMQKRSTLVRDLIDLWNINFFLPRGVEVVLYKGRERRSGPKLGISDIRLEYEDDEPYTSDTDTSEDSDLSGEERYRAQEYGVYGRQPVGQMTEMLEARRRRREAKIEKRRRRKEKKIKRKQRARENKYALYLTFVAPVGSGGNVGFGGMGGNVSSTPGMTGGYGGGGGMAGYGPGGGVGGFVGPSAGGLSGGY